MQAKLLIYKINIYFDYYKILFMCNDLVFI